jgi:hypothetical protein
LRQRHVLPRARLPQQQQQPLGCGFREQQQVLLPFAQSRALLPRHNARSDDEGHYNQHYNGGNFRLHNLINGPLAPQANARRARTPPTD